MADQIRRAGVRRQAAASGSEVAEVVAELGEFADAPVQVSGSAFDELEDVRARRAAVLPEADHAFDLPEGETDRLGGPDEPQPVKNCLGVVAIPGVGPFRRREQPDTLVVAQRLGGHPGLGCNLADAHDSNLPLDLPSWGKVHAGRMAATAGVDVRLLYFEECPNWRVAAARIKEALADVGGDPDAVVYEQVTSVERAEALGFQGSPTILVDGTDPFADPFAPAGLACRLYRTAGGAQPAPTVEQLRAALAR